MKTMPYMNWIGEQHIRLIGTTILAIVWCVAPTLAQQNGNVPGLVQNDTTAQSDPARPPSSAGTDKTANRPAQSDEAPKVPIVDNQVKQAGCPTCGGGLLAPAASVGGCSSCGGGGCNGCCTPGRSNCCSDCCSGDTAMGRMINGIHRCICCPDPCYEPHWEGVTDAAFFVDAVRPVTQMRIRWDNGFDMPHPDKAEYFWASQKGKGPHAPPAESSLDYRDFSYYTEAAASLASAFIELPYRQIEPDFVHGKSGFADMNVGAKSLLLDCELLQIGFQFRTYIPTGDFGKGLGTGHVSLEPSLLMGLRLTPTTYLESQFAYWIPVGGDSVYEGPIFHYHISLNQVLYRWCGDVQLIGTAEMVGYEIMGGAYTDHDTGLTLSAKDVGHIFSMGPGIRLVICNKIDFGVGTQFTLSDSKMADEFIRAEFRWRF